MKNFISTSLTFSFYTISSLRMLLFNGYCPVLMVSQAFGKSKELRQVTSSNVVTGLQRKRFGTRISPSALSFFKALILSKLDSIFVLTFLNLGRTRDGVRGGGVVPAPIRFFFNFSNVILHQRLPLRVSLRHILT